MEHNEEELNDFLNACDNMAKSKFIFADKKISEILKTIATTKSVYNTIAESMINFNFTSSYKVATANPGDFNLPDEERFIAFVFCMLKAIDDGKININELLVKHFPCDDDKHSSYKLFCDKIVLPFKNQIYDKLMGKQTKQVVKKEVKVAASKTTDHALLERLAFLVKDIKSYVSGIKKIKGSKIAKQDYIEIIDMFLYSIDNNQASYFKFFVKLLNLNCGRDKELKSRLTSIIEIVGE